MSVYIGIEGVGLRQSVAVVADETGTILSSYRMVGEPLSLHTTDRRILRMRLCHLIREASARAGRRLDGLSDATVCIGLTGVSFPYDAEIDLPEEFSKLEIQVHSLVCTGDAEIVFASHACTDSGSAILCHMGSTAFATRPGTSVRVGGWGPAIDDGGSGFWIGREALKAVGTEYDSDEPASSLWKAIDEWLANPHDTAYTDCVASSIVWRKQRALYGRYPDPYDKRTALFTFSHTMSLQMQWQWRAIVSSLAIPVMKTWRQGNKTAERIVLRAVEQLVRQYKQACSRLQVPRAISPLVLHGGVITHNDDFRELLLKKLGNTLSLPDTIITPASVGTMRPACGALLFALGHSRTGDLRLPSEDVIRTLRLNQRHLHTTGELQND